MKLRLPALHAAQAEIRDSEARFRVVAAGRRFGKTLLGSALCIAVAARGGRTWWVAPSYKMAAVGWRGIRQLAAQIPLTQVHKVRMLVTLPSGGTVQVRSADDPQSLRGEGLDFCVLDECAFMREEAWAEALRPALSDRQGGAMFISTPKGRNWFWRLYQRGTNMRQTGPRGRGRHLRIRTLPRARLPMRVTICPNAYSHRNTRRNSWRTPVRFFAA